MAQDQLILEATKIVKRSNLDKDKKKFWLDRIAVLPKPLLNRLVIQLQRIEVIETEKEFLSAFNSLPIEKIFDPVERKKAARKLEEIEEKKVDLRKAEEIREKILGKS